MGKVNQRSATYCQPSGVQMLTTAITNDQRQQHVAGQLAHAVLQRAFTFGIMSRWCPAARIGQQRDRCRQKRLKVSQSSAEPTETPPLNVEAAVNHGAAHHHAWLKVAKAGSRRQRSNPRICGWDGVALKRNSKATPRKMRPISIAGEGSSAHQ